MLNVLTDLLNSMEIVQVNDIHNNNIQRKTKPENLHETEQCDKKFFTLLQNVKMEMGESKREKG